MRRGRALGAEVLNRLDQAPAEEHLPPAIDGHAGGERMPRIDKPAGQRQPVGGDTCGQRRQPGRHARLDSVAGLVVLAAVEYVRLPRRVEVGHHHHAGRPRVDRLDPFLDLLEPGGDRFGLHLRWLRLNAICLRGIRLACVFRRHRRLQLGLGCEQRRQFALVGIVSQGDRRLSHADELLARVGHGRIGDVVEEGEEPVVVALRDRIKLVVVAAGALEREPHEGGGGRLDPVGHIFDAVFLRDDAPFGREHVVATEAGCDPLRPAGIGQEIAGELLHDEAVVGHVAGEGVDHPVAPRPLRPLLVVVVAVGVGVAGDVEPLQRHPLGMPWRGEQPIDHLPMSAGRLVGEECGPLVGRRRQAGEVERDPPQPCLPRGLGRGCELFLGETGEHELIDRVAWPAGMRAGGGNGNRLTLHRLKRPVRLVAGPLGDPLLEQFDLLRREWLLEGWWRHDRVCIGRRDPGHEFALGDLSGHDRPHAGIERRECRFAEIEPQPGLAGVFVEAVAVEAVGGEDRLDVAGVGEPPRGLVRGRGCVRGRRHEAQPRDPVEYPAGDELHARVAPVVGIAEGGVERVDGGGARHFFAQFLDGGVVGRVARHEPCHHDRRVAADLLPQSGQMLLDGRFPLLQWRARDRVVDAERKKDDSPHLLIREQSLRRGDPAAKRLEIPAVSRPFRDPAASLAGLYQVDRQALLRQPLGPVCQLQFETVCFRGLEPRVAQQIVGADVEGPENERVVVEDLHR